MLAAALARVGWSKRAYSITQSRSYGPMLSSLVCAMSRMRGEHLMVWFVGGFSGLLASCWAWGRVPSIVYN